MTEQFRGTIDMEKTREVTGKFVARLGDLGLGNRNGIPSRYAEADEAKLNEIAEQNARMLVYPTNVRCKMCVDGRCLLHFADGSPAETCLRRVGGSASNYGVALNAEASIVDTLNSDAPLGEQIQQLEELMGEERSAHEGGCGGANGEVDDHLLIANDPKILAAAKAFMEIPEVLEYLGVGYDEMLGERVRSRAAITAEYLQAKGWNGQKYVDGVKKQHPGNVAVLEVDHEDKQFHGHKEPSLTIIIGDKTMPLDHDGFVWNLKATKEAAEKLAGQRGQEGYVQALIADIAKHMAVCKRLPSEETPIFLVAA